MNKQLTLFTQSGFRHTVLSIEQLSNLAIPFPFVGTANQYETFLGTLSILNPNSKLKHRHAGAPQDVPFGSLVWWIEYTQEY